MAEQQKTAAGKLRIFARGGWLLIAALLLLLFLVLFSVLSRQQDPTRFRNLQLSTPKQPVQAPDFSLKDPTGRTVELRGFRGKVVFLNFWATWCVPCRREMPAMEALFREFNAKGLTVLAVNVQESPRQVTQFIHELKITFPVVLDSNGAVTGDYGVRALPTTYLIGKKGEVLAMGLGSREWAGDRFRPLFHSLLGLPQ